MDTINIINDFDSKILMENMLITNQLKLLNMCKNIFEMCILKEKKLSISEIKDYINKQKFINWELFVNLINLESEFINPRNRMKTSSLEYLIQTKSFGLIEFCLDFELDFKFNLINWKKQNTNKNIFQILFKNLCENDIIINKLIDIMIKNNLIELFKEKNTHNKSCLNYTISKCSEQVLIRLLELGFIELDWIDTYTNNLIHWACKRNLNKLFNLIVNDENNNFNLDRVNNGKRSALHLACINNNIDLVRILVKKNVEIELEDNDLKCPLNYAIKYGNSELVKLLLDQNLNIFLTKSDSKIFYEIIQYQDENMVKYFIEKNFMNIDNTSLFWTTLLCMNKKYYSQIYLYGTKKIMGLINDFIKDFNRCHDGHLIDDMFYDNSSKFTI
jgi:ankyrin repeat protein